VALFLFLDILTLALGIAATYSILFNTNIDTYYIQLNQYEFKQLHIFDAFNALITTNNTVFEATIKSNPVGTVCSLLNLTGIYTPTNVTLNYSTVKNSSIRQQIKDYYCSYTSNQSLILRRIAGSFKSKLV
jgi:hypothetical protein